MTEFDKKSSGKGKKQEKSSEDEKILREKGDEGAKTREEDAVKNQRETETPSIEEPNSEEDLGQNAGNGGDSGGGSGNEPKKSFIMTFIEEHPFISLLGAGFATHKAYKHITRDKKRQTWTF